MTKIFMKPLTVDFGDEESGIRRVVEAYEKHLPEFGYEFTKNRDEADVSIGHAGILVDPDILICHGLYWTAEYGVPAPKWEYNSNRELVSAIRYAKQVTVTAKWVQETFARDMRMKPAIVPHGVDWDEWQIPVKRTNDTPYVLWNKNRAGVDVCSTSDMERLASIVPDMMFLSTFGGKEAPPNVNVIGLQPHDEMRKYVKCASVYLSTIKETFGIGILEALAAGVPVLGWHGGGIEDLVQHGVNGYLAYRGDFDDLKLGLEYCLKNRKVLGDNGRIIAKEYTWEKAVEKLHFVIQAALHVEPPTVSVVIPCYNYGEKVERAIGSVQNQTRVVDEIIVVDDGSNEENAALTKEVCERVGVTYLRKNNGGVATARNAGVNAASGKYICCLDADDFIAPKFIETCVNALEADRTLSLAYTGLWALREDGTGFQSEWPPEYDFDKFLRKQNQVPTCCVYKREMWERLGGYNQKYAPTGAGAEDAEFWLRAGAYGFVAKRVTNEPLFVYSIGTGHTSKPGYQEVDWLAFHPWTKDDKHPFASLATPKNGFSHPVRHYDEPTISVIVPVGPGHQVHIYNVMDSIEAQGFRKWEVIVVFDNWDGDAKKISEREDFLADFEIAYPYVRVIVNKEKNKGAGWARNKGAESARSPLLLFLDADDWLYPEALQKMYDAWTTSGMIVYTDYVSKSVVNEEFAIKAQAEGRLLDYSPKTGEVVVSSRAGEYTCPRAVRQPDPNDMYIWNLITSLVPRAWHRMIGGFDENMESWEDWDYWIRMARAGFCFTRIPEPLVVYRFYTGNRRETGLQQYPRLVQYLQDKYSRSEIVACSGCGSKNAQNSNPAIAQLPVQKQVASMSDSEYVLCLYDHPNRGNHRVIGAATRVNYGYRGGGEQFYVHKKDIALEPHVYKPIVRTVEIENANEAPSVPVPIVETKEEHPTPRKIVMAQPDATDLQRLPGVSDSVARELNAAGIYSVDQLKTLSVDDLMKIKGIGRGRALSIREYFDQVDKVEKAPV